MSIREYKIAGKYERVTIQRRDNICIQYVVSETEREREEERVSLCYKMGTQVILYLLFDAFMKLFELYRLARVRY